MEDLRGTHRKAARRFWKIGACTGFPRMQYYVLFIVTELQTQYKLTHDLWKKKSEVWVHRWMWNWLWVIQVAKESLLDRGYMDPSLKKKNLLETQVWLTLSTEMPMKALGVNFFWGNIELVTKHKTRRGWIPACAVKRKKVRVNDTKSERIAVGDLTGGEYYGY